MSANSSSSTSKKHLLTEDQLNLCLKIAELEDETSSKRAKALLSVNDGLTQAAAAEASGLTVGQVRYLMTLFKKDGLSLFPDSVMKVAENSAAPVAKKPAKATTSKKAAPAKKDAEKKKEKPKSKKVAEKEEKSIKKSKKKRSKQAKKNKVLKAIRKQSKKKKAKKSRKKKK